MLAEREKGSDAPIKAAVQRKKDREINIGTAVKKRESVRFRETGWRKKTALAMRKAAKPFFYPQNGGHKGFNKRDAFGKDGRKRRALAFFRRELKRENKTPSFFSKVFCLFER